MGQPPAAAAAERPLHAAPGALPNLIVIGAAKCGTTSLHRYLGLHPEISMSSEKELDFFVAEANWPRGLRWYAAQFDAAAPVRGEASPKYSQHPLFEGVPARMARVVPEARLVYLVRDPLERLVSQYVHRVANGLEPASLTAALRGPGTERLLAPSRYATQLRRYLEHFPRERMLVVDADDLDRRRMETLSEVFRFLGVEPGFRHRGFRARLHPTRRKRRRTRLGRVLAAATRPLVRRLPFRWRGRVRWALDRPFSRTLPRPDVEPRLRRELVLELEPEVAWLRAWTGRVFPGWSL